MASNAKRTRYFRRLSAIGAVAALAVTGCASGDNGESNGSEPGTESPDQSQGGDTIVFQMNGDPNIVNPTMTTGWSDQQLGCPIFEGLTAADPNGVPIPELAESWDISEDGLEYTFHLVEANWHDGEPFTSEDVKFTYENYSSQYGPLWGDLGAIFEGVDTPDPRTAVVRLSEPFAPMVMMTRCSHNGVILPKHIYEDVDPAGSELKDVTPVGTGPFTWGESTPGQRYTLERNDDYWRDGLPLAERLIGLIITDTASAVSAIRAGEIDYISSLQANAANQLEEVDGVEVEPVGFGQTTNQFLFFNVEREPFNEPAVRKALFQAIDRQYLIDHVYFGRGKPGVSSLTDGIWAYTGEVDYNELFPYDPDAAAAALDEAGYPEVDGTRFSLDFLVRNDPPERIELANVIAAMWDQIGVDVNVIVNERAAENVAAFQEFNFDANIQGYTNQGDPAAGTARAYICSSIGRNFGNPSQYCNPELDAMWEHASQLTDIDERAEVYGQIDLEIAEYMPTLVIIQEISEYARASNLQGIEGRTGSYDWAHAYIED